MMGLSWGRAEDVPGRRRGPRMGPRTMHPPGGAWTMGQSETEPAGPDLARGVPLSEIGDDEIFAGHVDGEAVILVRSGAAWHALGASCTHYGVSLADGLVVEGTLRCPAHHAAFDVATGEAVRGPALRGLTC